MSIPSTSHISPTSDYNQHNDLTNESTQPDHLEDGKHTDPNNSEHRKPRSKRGTKFTRGEKCLFTHLVVTFALLLLLLIMYIVHLYVVKHRGYDMFDGILRTRPVAPKSDYIPVGMVHVLPDYYMCNSLLLRPTWSIAPAHCVAARSDPDLAYALPNWRITYGRYEGSLNADGAEEYIDTPIIRSVAHPHFNRDDFQNNVGLLQHGDPIDVFSYAIFGNNMVNLCQD